MKKSNFSFIFFGKKIDFERLIFCSKTRKMYFFQKTTCNFIKRGYITLLSHLRRDGRAVEGAALEMLFRRNPNASSNLALSAIFYAKKMANEAARLHFTVPSGTTSLKTQSFFFTSSPNSRSLACEVAPFGRL